MCHCQICRMQRHKSMYHKEEITETLFHIFRNYYYLSFELSGWKGSVSYGLGADISLPHYLATAIWTLARPKRDLRPEISGSIVRYDALAPRPEVLLYWHFVRACADSLKLKSLPYSWQKYSQRVNKYNFGGKKITKEAFRALAIPQSTPTNGRKVFAYRVFKWYNFINTSTPVVIRTWMDGSTVYRWDMVLEGIISAVLDSALPVKSLMDKEYELKLRLKRLLSLIITDQMFLQFFTFQEMADWGPNWNAYCLGLGLI